MSSFKLRPHHGLCIHFFEGRGYSAEFTDNMTAVIQKLNASSPIQLAAGEDSICACCPNSAEHACVYSDKVMRYDRTVLDFCGLETGQTLSWDQFQQKVQDRIIRRGRIRAVCGDCKWGVICFSRADTIAKNENPYL